jgi:hypothetical protein
MIICRYVCKNETSFAQQTFTCPTLAADLKGVLQNGLPLSQRKVLHFQATKFFTGIQEPILHTTSIYNASVVNFYYASIVNFCYATGSPARLKKLKEILYYEKRSSLLQLLLLAGIVAVNSKVVGLAPDNVGMYKQQE